MANKIKGFRAFWVQAMLLVGLFMGNHPVAFAQEGHDSLARPETAVSEASGHEQAGEEAHGEGKKFNAGEMIMEHIGDSHEWHLFGHTHLPLPIILYTPTGLELFSSSRLAEGAIYNSYKLEKNHIKVVDASGMINEEASSKIIDISITKNVASMLFSISIMLLVFLSVAKAYTRNSGKAPSGLQSMIEPIILFIRDDIAKASIGKKYERYMPYLLTIFFFIWINNLLGLIPIFPGGANLTGNIAVPLTLACFTFVITILSGNAHYWKHIFAMPGVPKWVLVILTPIEVLGIFIKPFVLMVRLFANITAGHIVLLVFFCLIFIFGQNSPTTGYITAIPAILFTVFINCLELLVGLLQAYVFTFLSAIYFGMATAEDPHAHAEGHH